MASQNPIAGGPDFVVVLRNALEKTQGGYVTPPPTGGTQISSRFADDRLAILDAVCEHSGWNRNQVINAFVDRGLFELFSYVGDDVVEKIMTHAAERVIPTFDPSAALLKQLTAYNRFRIYPALQRIRDGQTSEVLDKVWTVSFVDREKGTVTLDEATQLGYRLPLHITHIDRVQPDTVQDTKDGFKNALLTLNVQVILKGQNLALMPIARGTPAIKRQGR
jgi:hypothetical protein